MTLSEIKNLVMFQTGNDIEDVTEYEPYIDSYVNEGYDLLLSAMSGKRVPSADYPVLSSDNDTPILPEWAHIGIAYYATYCVYRNGNPQKQSRGQAYINDFERIKQRILNATSGTGMFKNIPN